MRSWFCLQEEPESWAARSSRVTAVWLLWVRCCQSQAASVSKLQKKVWKQEKLSCVDHEGFLISSGWREKNGAPAELARPALWTYIKHELLKIKAKPLAFIWANAALGQRRVGGAFVFTDLFSNFDFPAWSKDKTWGGDFQWTSPLFSSKALEIWSFFLLFSDVWVNSRTPPILTKKKSESWGRQTPMPYVAVPLKTSGSRFQ